MAYLAVSLARMAAFRSVLILASRGKAGASVEVDAHRKPNATVLRMHLWHKGLPRGGRKRGTRETVILLSWKIQILDWCERNSR